MMEFAELLGEKNDYNYFRDLGINIKNAFHMAYYNDRQNSYHDSSLTYNLLPLYFDIVHGREPRYSRWLTPVNGITV